MFLLHLRQHAFLNGGAFLRAVFFAHGLQNDNGMRLSLIGLKILTMCASWKFSVKSTMIGRFVIKAKSIKSPLCPNVLPPSKNVPLKRRFQDTSPSPAETTLSLIFCLSKLSKIKWVLTCRQTQTSFPVRARWSEKDNGTCNRSTAVSWKNPIRRRRPAKWRNPDKVRNTWSFLPDIVASFPFLWKERAILFLYRPNTTKSDVRKFFFAWGKRTAVPVINSAEARPV